LALFVAAAVAHSGSARAQTPNEQRGMELFERGRELTREGRCAEAIPFFTASLEQAPAVGPLLNLGHCYETLGKTASAADAFSRAAEVAAQRNDPRKEEAVAREQALEPFLSTLRIVVPKNIQPTVLEVRIDGAPLPRSQWDLERPIDPGSHALEVGFTGRGHRATTVIVGAKGDHASYVVTAPDPPATIGPPPATEPATDTTNEGRSSAQRTVGLVTGAAGIAGLVAGAVFGVLSLNARADVHDTCPAYPHCPMSANMSDLDSKNDSAIHAGNAATIAFVSGGALLAIGAVVLLSAP
jgi:hypothetical protein